MSTPRPWVKYARRGRPSTISEQTASPLRRLAYLFFGEKEGDKRLRLFAARKLKGPKP